MSSLRVIGLRSDVTSKWEHRYREVLDAAAIAFAEKGYLGASTRDIAERLGIRAASLYYYLPSKEAALLAICKLGVLDFIDNLKDIIAQPEPAPEKLQAAITNHLLPLRSRPAADYIRSLRPTPSRIAEWTASRGWAAGARVSGTDSANICRRYCDR